MTKKLTLDERHHISMYARRLPCTVALRFKIDQFFNTLEITSEELKKYDVTIDPKTMEFSCNDSEYTVEYEDFDPVIIDSLESFIVMFNHEKHKNNEMLQRAFKYFKKII